MSILLAAAEPLQLADRDPFLRDVAAELAAHPVLGDGIVTRVCAMAQRKYLASGSVAFGKAEPEWTLAGQPFSN